MVHSQSRGSEDAGGLTHTEPPLGPLLAREQGNWDSECYPGSRNLEAGWDTSSILAASQQQALQSCQRLGLLREILKEV